MLELVAIIRAIFNIDDCRWMNDCCGNIEYCIEGGAIVVYLAAPCWSIIFGGRNCLFLALGQHQRARSLAIELCVRTSLERTHNNLH